MVVAVVLGVLKVVVLLVVVAVVAAEELIPLGQGALLD
jgi:hypothetical protein